MKTLRFVLIALYCLFAASCGRQNSLDASNQRASLIRAANGNIYASACLKKATSAQDVLDCEVDENSGSSRGIAGRGAYEYGNGGSNGYYNPIAAFDPFAVAVNTNSNYYGNNYFNGGNQSNTNYGSSSYYNGLVWQPEQFQTSSWNNFFQSSSTSVWNNDPYGWYKFLYGNYGDYNNYGGGYNSGYQGSSICDVAWVNQPGYYSEFDQNYLLCGNPWSPEDGYGYQPGYGGYYPQQGQNVFEMKIVHGTSGAQIARYYLVGNSTSSRQASYQIWKDVCSSWECTSQAYGSINKSKFDNILNLVNRINTTTMQAEATPAVACQYAERRVLTVQNGSKPISDRMKPCGAASLNTSPYARRLEQAILQVLNLPSSHLQ